jgi:hypothetical protein
MSYVRPDRRIMRASDADRERAVDFLRRHAGEGRLDVDELSDRVGRALSSKTLGELDDLTYDLPVETASAAPVVAAPPLPRQRQSVAGFVAARIALMYLVLLAAIGTHHAARLVLVAAVLITVLSMRGFRRVTRRYDRSAPRGPGSGPPWQLPF